MHKVNITEFEKISRDNFENNLALRKLHKALKDALSEKNNSSVILLEIPAENYSELNFSSVQYLLDNGYEGVYVSFQRPFNNLCSIFDRNGIDVNRLYIVDSATVFSGESSELNSRCVNIPSDFEVEAFIKKVYDCFSKLESDKKFVFVDSLTTMALHKSLSETMHFSEGLITKLKNQGSEDAKILFNVAENLTRKRYIENLSVYSDEHIHLGLCT